MSPPLHWRLANLYDETVEVPGRKLVAAANDGARAHGSAYLDEVRSGNIFLAARSGLLGMANLTLSSRLDAALTLGGGIVDVLRLGQGVAKGSAWGYVEDGLRLFSIGVPAAKALAVGGIRGMAGSSFGGPAIQRVMTAMDFDPTRGVCAWVATRRALFLSGRFWLRLDDLIQVSGLNSVRELSGMAVSEGREVLNRLGVKYREVIPAGQQPITVQAAVDLVERLPHNSVAIMHTTVRTAARAEDAVAALSTAAPRSAASSGDIALLRKKLEAGDLRIAYSSVKDEASGHAVVVHRGREGVTVYDRENLVHSSVGNSVEVFEKKATAGGSGWVQLLDANGETTMGAVRVAGVRHSSVRSITVLENAALMPGPFSVAPIAIEMVYVRVRDDHP